MKIYLASGFNRRFALRAAKAVLNEKGVEVTSSWIGLDKRPERNDPEWRDFAIEIARTNMNDLRQADTLIIDGGGIQETNHGGVFTELGLALAWNYSVYYIGRECANTFMNLPNIIRMPDWLTMWDEINLRLGEEARLDYWSIK